FPVTVGANPAPGSRAAMVTVGSKGVAVVQSGTSGGSCSGGVFAPGVDDFPSDGGHATVTLTAGNNCVWSATSDSSWLKADPSMGAGDQIVGYVVHENGTGATRTGRVTFYG